MKKTTKKKLFHTIALTATIGLLAGCSNFYQTETNSSEVSVTSLLNEMCDQNSLTKMPKHFYQLKQFSSYDRNSKINNPADGEYYPGKKTGKRDHGKGWFANADQSRFLRTEKIKNEKRYVLFDHKGPGAIVRFWDTMGGSAFKHDGIFRIYLDGNPTPVIKMRNKELIGGNGLIGKPFSFLASDITTNPQWRGRNLYFPIPYQKSCKITYTPLHPKGYLDSLYYNINYRAYKKGTKIKTFSMADIENNKNLIATTAAKLLNPKPNPNKLQKTKIFNKEIKSGKDFKLNVTTRPKTCAGAIKNINFTLKAPDLMQALRSTVLEIKFDNKQTVWTPVGAFFGIGYGIEKNKNYYVTATPKYKCIELNSLWVMPFKDKAEIIFHNYGKQNVKIENLSAKYSPYSWDKESMYFHATWFEMRKVPTIVRRDFNFVTIKGEGRYVGDSSTIYNTKGDWWGEGDEKIYVDNEKFPSHFGTGTEDYYGYAWCRPQRFYSPFNSQPRGEGNKKPGYSTNNRYRILDDIPFTKSLKFDMELWHPFRSVMNWAPTTFFYAKPNATWNIKPNIDAVKHKVAKKTSDVVK